MTASGRLGDDVGEVGRQRPGSGPRWRRSRDRPAAELVGGRTRDLRDDRVLQPVGGASPLVGVDDQRGRLGSHRSASFDRCSDRAWYAAGSPDGRQAWISMVWSSAARLGDRWRGAVELVAGGGDEALARPDAARRRGRATVRRQYAGRSAVTLKRGVAVWFTRRLRRSTRGLTVMRVRPWPGVATASAPGGVGRPGQAGPDDRPADEADDREGRPGARARRAAR